MSPVVHRIAARYRESVVGRTGEGCRDLIFVFKDLLASAGCSHGIEKFEAVRDLTTLEKMGVLILERHRRDREAILKVRLPLAAALHLFEILGEESPEAEREALARLFEEAERCDVPSQWQEGWQRFCGAMRSAAREGKSVQPFERKNPQQVREILAALPGILRWQGESFLRFASAAIFGNSKTLEALRGRVEKCLEIITAGKANTLAEFGILENDRSLLLHGPCRFDFGCSLLDISCLEKPIRMSMADFSRASIQTAAKRCLIVENAAMLHELAKCRDQLLLCSSGSEGGFANSATISFLRKIPDDLEIWHFGDSDPAGFDILRDLRERSERVIHSLHMELRKSTAAPSTLLESEYKTIERLLTSPWLLPIEKAELRKMLDTGDKGAFEQESLGRPTTNWPYF